ncbi:N-alpha-acetyltransferase, non-catalitic subunit [Microbotryomycetes sp. JL201]|nr:N-alpha-acetyltransferase, non-catalitic subunit [Microbotryomycetes sp. JL201]
MEPRTDSYLTLKRPNSHMNEQELFDCTAELLPHELVWIIDELVRRETTFHDGHPLAWTLFTCKYLRPSQLERLATSDKPMHVILKAILMGTIKTTEIIWEELAKAQIYEHEDVHLNMASLNFTELLLACKKSSTSDVVAGGEGQDGPIVTVDEVIQALSTAIALLSEQSMDDYVKAALAAHLSMRLNVVYSLALLTSPQHTSALDIHHYLSLSQDALVRLQSTPRTEFAPSEALMAVYALGTSAPLPSPQPPKDIPPLSFRETWTRYHRLIRETQSAVALWQAWDRKNSWATLQEYFADACGRNMLPYSRSIHQSIILSGQTVFGSSSILSVSFAFCSDLVGIDLTWWTTLQSVRDAETTWDAPARRVLGWVERFGVQLVTLLWNRCQNRARARRLTIKGFKQLLQLGDEVQVTAQRAEKIMEDSARRLLMIKPAIDQLVLFELAEVLLSGFELDLYEENEWCQVWWIAERILSRARQALDVLRSTAATSYLEYSSEYLSVLGGLCRASVLMSDTYLSEPAKTASPFLIDVEPETRDCLRFEQRFGWAMSCASDGDILANMCDHQQWLNRSRPSDPATARTEARDLFSTSATAISSILGPVKVREDHHVQEQAQDVSNLFDCVRLESARSARVEELV